ncbi:hypothetical protein SY83_16175 [Paenibacillus swuensis]|uniref:Uncharacterized protein n=1 Tax=Paenibacillus swuensis TaxID=1178515 RepID=A0A172TKX3_9BACL|nr:hypothetical protein SY83_16175 [Paenibacillus swuensis]
MNSWAYIALLGSVVAVFASMMPRRSHVQDQGATMKEFDESLGHFMGEMEQENKELLSLLAALKNNQASDHQRLLHRVEQLEKENAGLSAKVSLLSETLQAWKAPRAYADEPAAAETLMHSDLNLEQSPEIHSENEQAALLSASSMNIKERYHEVFRLYEQGKSTEYIARTLSMNKGELQLILQLGQQEASMRA